METVRLGASIRMEKSTSRLATSIIAFRILKLTTNCFPSTQKVWMGYAVIAEVDQCGEFEE